MISQRNMKSNMENALTKKLSIEQKKSAVSLINMLARNDCYARIFGLSNFSKTPIRQLF